MISLVFPAVLFFVVLIVAHVDLVWWRRPKKEFWFRFDYAYYGVGALALLTATMKLNDMIDDIRLYYPQANLAWNYRRASDAARSGESRFRNDEWFDTLSSEDKEMHRTLSNFFHRALTMIDQGYQVGAWRSIAKEAGTDLDLPMNEMLQKISLKGRFPVADYVLDELLVMLKHVRDCENEVAAREEERRLHKLSPEQPAHIPILFSIAILPWALSIVLALRITRASWELTEPR